jgi:ketosteroid isomerase-like protein
MTGTVQTTDEEQIRTMITERAEAQHRGDAAAIVAHYAPGAVLFDLAPPLATTSSPDTQAAGLQQWFTGFDGPVEFTVRDLTVTVGNDVAFSHSLSSLTATPTGSPMPFTLWFRSTLGLRRIAGVWQITHEHKSTPFHMEMDESYSFRAATDLQP